MKEQLEIKPGEFYLADEKEPGVFTILFHGIWQSLSDAFIGGGIVKHRFEEEDKGTSLLYHDDDEELLK